MGDNGELYVSKELVPAYRDQIISLATVLTPNQYEAEVLTGIKIDSKKSALQACQALHDRGVATVVRVASVLLIIRQWSAVLNAWLQLESLYMLRTHSTVQCAAGFDQHSIVRFGRRNCAHSQHSSQPTARLLLKRSSKHSTPGCILHWHRWSGVNTCVPHTPCQLCSACMLD